MSFGKTIPILRIFAWESRGMFISEPFGNRLTFTNAISA